ncbi:uncharacterized protein LOC8042562 [Ixodes scapularis]|uniref:uncharacterized protein LOC8042562 n=1 Tax=Ixodes scapularis TaxID=6945 RepID=UPI001A9E0B92|nr:uncharacterized protein LOC8042562 [Ixodes scapularis]
MCEPLCPDAMSGDPPVVTESAEPPKALPKKKKYKRQNYCFAPGCKTGKGRTTDPECHRASMFSVPKDDEMFERWKRYMPPRPDGRLLSRDAAVCSRHFDPQFILRYFEHVVNKELVRIERGKPTLTTDAVPTIFPDSPKYYTRRVPRRRKLPERTIPPPKVPRRRNGTHATTAEQSDDGNNGATAVDNVADNAGVSPSMPSNVQNCVLPPIANEVETVIEREVTPVFPYEDLPLPSCQWAKHVIREKPTVLAYSVCSLDERTPGQLKTEKLVLIEEKDCHADCKVYLCGMRVHCMEGAGGTDHPSELLQRVDRLARCPGVIAADEYPFGTLLGCLMQLDGRLYSPQCKIVGTSRGRMCYACACARKVMLRKRARLRRKAARSVVVVLDDPGTDDSGSSVGLHMNEECRTGSKADVNGHLEAGEAEDPPGTGDESGLQRNGTKEKEVPCKTVTFGPIPICKVKVQT